MEWLTVIKSSINYMEDNILTVTGPEEVAKNVSVSTMYLQRGFQILTGYTLGEYIRNRRLYLAALDIMNTDIKVIDASLKYGYETPESFTKAFSRFHDVSPSDMRSGKGSIRTFLKLRISINIHGGSSMNFRIEKTAAFRVIGFSREFDNETSYRDIPKFWDEIMNKYMSQMCEGKEPTTEMGRAISENRIGEFGVCVDDVGCNKFRYIIAGRYNGGNVPEGMVLYEVPETKWAKFPIVGELPEALQSVNTQIWNGWLPGNKDFELAGRYNIEWYSPEDGKDDSDCHSAIWIPVKEKE